MLSTLKANYYKKSCQEALNLYESNEFIQYKGYYCKLEIYKGDIYLETIN